MPILFERFNPNWKYKLVILLILLPLLFTNAYSLNSGISQKPQKEMVAEYLEENGLNVGYATYWNADAITILSNYRVRIYHIDVGEMKPRLFMSSPDLYRPTGEQNNFLMLTNKEVKNFDLSALDKYIGKPKQVLEFQNYKIYVYDKLFADYLPDWSATLENAAK